MLCVVAAYAHGQTVIKGVSELRIKESNRAEAIIININNMGGTAQIINNNLIITPKNKLHNTTIESFNDNRILPVFCQGNLNESIHSKLFSYCKKRLNKANRGK